MRRIVVRPSANAHVVLGSEILYEEMLKRFHGLPCSSFLAYVRYAMPSVPITNNFTVIDPGLFHMFVDRIMPMCELWKLAFAPIGIDPNGEPHMVDVVSGSVFIFPFYIENFDASIVRESAIATFGTITEYLIALAEA